VYSPAIFRGGTEQLGAEVARQPGDISVADHIREDFLNFMSWGDYS
jgi:hypothetical protein